MPSEPVPSWRERRNQLRAKRKQEEGSDNEDNANDLEALSHLLHVRVDKHKRDDNSRNRRNRNMSGYNASANANMNSYVPHVSAAKRMRMERDEVLRSMTGGEGTAEADGDKEGETSLDRSTMAKSRKAKSKPKTDEKKKIRMPPLKLSSNKLLDSSRHSPSPNDKILRKKRKRPVFSRKRPRYKPTLSRPPPNWPTV